MKINPKSEKGAVTLIALVTVLFMISFLMSMYILMSNRAQKSSDTTAEIKKRYDNLQDAESMYSNFFSTEDIIPIYTVEQLMQLGSGNQMEIDGKYYTFSSDGYYTLKNDLDLGGYDYSNDTWINSNQWSPLPHDFTGCLDGLGYTIKGLYINEPSSNYQGLFGELNGTVKNLNIRDSFVKGSGYVGSIAGLNNGTIKNCTNTGIIIGSSNVTGGYFTTESDTNTILYDVWKEKSILSQNLRFVSGQDIAIVPQGFQVSVDVLEQTIADGMVIKDEEKNEFVWVQVKYTPTNTDSNSNGLDDGFDSKFYISAWSNNNRTTGLDARYKDDETTDITGKFREMAKSVQDNNGFYIGRYETGQPENGNIVVKRDKKPYTLINWGDSFSQIGTTGALYQCLNMYTGNDYGVISTMCYGVQWDAALDFIKSSRNVTACTNWGNHKDNAWTINRQTAQYYDSSNSVWKKISEESNGKKTKTNTQSFKLTTGANDDFQGKNIFDLSGNVWEMTMEARPDWNQYIDRGGDATFNGTTHGAFYRSSYTPTDASNNFIGFRVTLYIKPQI